MEIADGEVVQRTVDFEAVAAVPVAARVDEAVLSALHLLWRGVGELKRRVMEKKCEASRHQGERVIWRILMMQEEGVRARLSSSRRQIGVSASLASSCEPAICFQR